MTALVHSSMPAQVGLLAGRAVRRALDPFGDQVAERQAGSVAVRLDSGVEQLADIVRALDAASIAIANLALHEPTLDDVFLAKTGRSLEGAGDGGAESPIAAQADGAHGQRDRAVA